MLKSRLLTAFLIGPLILWAIYALPAIYFIAFAFVLVSVGAWEWSAFITEKLSTRVIFSAVNILLFAAIFISDNSDINLLIIMASLLWWIVSIPLLLSFPFSKDNVIHTKFVTAVIGTVLLLATFVAMVTIRQDRDYGSAYILYLILLIWFADSGAYFAGRALGKNKLLPTVSPGKTWEGVIGALVVTTIVSVVALNLLQIPSSQSLLFIVVTLITVIYSVIGDLSESMFKRMANIKDSGHIIPGHGGVLDRIDSMMSGFPIFFAGLWLMEKFG